MVSNDEIVAYEVDNTYKPTSEQWGGGLEANATMVDGVNPTEDSGVSNNHYFGYEEHGGDSEVEVDATMGSEFVDTRNNVSSSIYTSPLNILVNRNEWTSGSTRFLLGTKRIRGIE